MVPWAHLREPRLGRLSTDLTSEFTFFNLVIRLSKVKQWAFFLVSHRRSKCWTTCRSTRPHLFLGICSWQPWQTFLLSNVAQETDLANQHAPCEKAPGMSFSCRYGPFWYFWWGKPVVHLIREDLIAVLYPMWVDRPRSCNGNNVRLS